MSEPAREKEFNAYITIRCSEATRDELAMLAKEDRRSMSNYTRAVLEDHVLTVKAARQAEPAAA